MAAPLTLLVIDPNEEDVDLLTEALADAKSPSFAITHVFCVDDALVIADRATIDLIVLDLEGEGTESFFRLRSELPDLPIIMLTKVENEPLALNLLRQGAQDYQLKTRATPDQLIRCFLFAVERQKRLLEAKVDKSDTTVIDLGRNQYIEGKATTVVDGYRLLRLLGEGSIGRVFLAEPTTDDCPFPNPLALKLLKPPRSLPSEGKEEWLERFCQEAELAKNIVHRHVVQIYDIGMSAETGGPYIAMEYVDGRILTRCQDQLGYLDFRQKAIVLRQLAEALGAIHASGICHLDIKPGNILITRDLEAKISDFGIAQPMGSTKREILGSPAYMSPEALRGHPPHPTSDIYSLGVVAYEWFLHRLPFRSRILDRLRDQILHDLPTEPRKLSPQFPPHLQAIIGKLLRKDPGQRYPHTQALRDDLDDFLAGRSMASDLNAPRPLRWLRRDWS